MNVHCLASMGYYKPAVGGVLFPGGVGDGRQHRGRSSALDKNLGQGQERPARPPRLHERVQCTNHHSEYPCLLLAHFSLPRISMDGFVNGCHNNIATICTLVAVNFCPASTHSTPARPMQTQ